MTSLCNGRSMLTYTSAELRHLAAITRTPLRAARKTLFTFHLWLPECQRSPVCECVRHAAPPFNSPPAFDPGSADRPGLTTVGWLNAQSIRNKSDEVSEMIIDQSLNVTVLTETFHTASDDACLRLATPPGYAVADAARPSRRGGGIAVIFRKNWKSATLPLPACTKFEAIALRLTVGVNHLLAVYRPGSEEVSSLFFD